MGKLFKVSSMHCDVFTLQSKCHESATKKSCFVCFEYASWIELIDTLTNTKISKYLTYILCNLAIVVCVHQLEGFLVLGLLPGELGPGEHPIPVLVVRLKHLVHILSDAENQSINQLAQ